MILPLWAWGYLILGVGIYEGLQRVLPNTAAGLIAAAITIVLGVGRFLWREGAFEKPLTPEELELHQARQRWLEFRSAVEADWREQRERAA